MVWWVTGLEVVWWMKIRDERIYLRVKYVCLMDSRTLGLMTRNEHLVC